MKRIIQSKGEQGQILVIVTVLLIGLFAMAALILDGGNAYLKRRRAQNAADAGALAGADVYCQTGNIVDATNAAIEYVGRNESAVNGAVTIIDGIVSVPTSITFDTFFAHLIGRPQITVEAIAEAGCFVPGAGTGVLPIAWSCSPYVGQEIPPDGECEIEYATEGDQPIYVIMDSDEEDITCQDPDSGEPEWGLDCDLDDDGDIDVFDGSARSWLDLDGNQQLCPADTVSGEGTASELRNWIDEGFPCEIGIHTWVPKGEGQVTSLFQEVALHEGDERVLPVFDMFCDGLPNVNCADQYHTSSDEYSDIIHSTNATDIRYYHIISFSLFHITCVRDSPSINNCPGFNALREANDEAFVPGQWNSMLSIEGYFVEGYIPGLVGRPDGGVGAGAYTIYLTK